MRFVWYLIGVVVVLAVVVVAGVQWLRTVPSPAFRASVPVSFHLPGRTPTLPWPATGEATVTVQGLGTLGGVGVNRVVPIASITKVMTAYLILHDHPLGSGLSGPSIKITAADVAEFKADVATQQSVLRVAAGEVLSERQALEGLLIPSANNMSHLLARWDSGTTAVFVAKMNAAAQALGLHHTHFAGPSGLNPGSTSSATDLLGLGDAAMAIPTFRHIVAMPQVTLPVAGLVFNFDYDLGRDGIVGIKTGSDGPAGGCLLFEAHRQVANHNVTIVGDVLGQGTVSPITAALADASNLVKASGSALGVIAAVPAGKVVGRVVTPWGKSVPVTVPTTASFFGWPGLVVHAKVVADRLRPPLPYGAPVASLHLAVANQQSSLPMQLSAPLHGPTLMWRMTRP